MELLELFKAERSSEIGKPDLKAGLRYPGL